jgi:hypothetical protein
MQVYWKSAINGIVEIPILPPSGWGFYGLSHPLLLPKPGDPFFHRVGGVFFPGKRDETHHGIFCRINNFKPDDFFTTWITANPYMYYLE